MLQVNLNDPKITQEEKIELEKLLSLQNPKITDDLEQIWYLMDKIWDDMGCDNKNLDWKKIGKYYSHPVWLLNGLFIETHELSMQIRENLANYIAQQGFKHICDYGGGFGTLAKTVAQKCPNSIIYVYEPHPSHYGLECIKEFPNIVFTDKLQENFYDCIISTDVLEHVEFPLQTFKEIVHATKLNGEGGGAIIMANCFYPCIKCHLPHNFHLRYSFNYFAQKMGVKKIDKIPNTHATVYKKVNHTTSMPQKWKISISLVLFYPLEWTKKIIKFFLNK